jgi:hypothetical protein
LIKVRAAVPAVDEPAAPAVAGKVAAVNELSSAIVRVLPRPQPPGSSTQAANVTMTLTACCQCEPSLSLAMATSCWLVARRIRVDTSALP